VAYSKGGPNSDIWIRELKRDAPMHLTFDPSEDKGSPVWSPDGSELLFHVSLGGKTHAGIYRKSSSGTGTEELWAQPKDPDTALWPTDWPRNGQFILGVQGGVVNRLRGEIWVLPVSGDRKPRVFVRAPSAAYDGQFSPDGHWVAYVPRESGREEVYVVPFDGNQVSNTQPFQQVPLKRGGRCPRTAEHSHGGAAMVKSFSMSAQGANSGIGVEVRGNQFSVSEVRSLFRQTLFVVASPYDVSPDGQRFLVNGFGERGTLPLTLVVNWKESLKNK